MIEYLQPRSLGEAVELLETAQPAQLLAGGTDLMNDLRLGHIEPVRIVDTAGLGPLRVLESTENALLIGAGTTMATLRSTPWLGALTDAAALLGGRQMQAVATIGGNVCRASPAAETATPLLVHEAEARVVGSRGERTIRIEDIWTGPRQTSLCPDEILVALAVDARASRWASAYRRLELRHSVDIAMVSAAASLDVRHGTVHEARIAIGAAGPVPTRVTDAERCIIGCTMELSPDGAPQGSFAKVISEAAEAAMVAARPIDDIRSSASYRRAMVGVVVRRALLAAGVRAKVGGEGNVGA